MRSKIIRAGFVVVLMITFAASFAITYQDAQAWDSECHDPFCIKYCLCQLEWQTGVFRNGVCVLNVCEVCNGPGVNCL